jgi:hypothetical protein
VGLERYRIGLKEYWSAAVVGAILRGRNCATLPLTIHGSTKTSPNRQRKKATETDGGELGGGERVGRRNDVAHGAGQPLGGSVQDRPHLGRARPACWSPGSYILRQAEECWSLARVSDALAGLCVVGPSRLFVRRSSAALGAAAAASSASAIRMAVSSKKSRRHQA